MKNKKILVAYTLLVTVIALILVSGSYARYTTQVSGSDEVIVAKFDVKVNNLNETINLFDFIDEDAVLDKEGLVAPGTKGNFSITLQNDSEVTTSYTISVSETNANNIPLVYSLEENGTYVSASELVNSALATGTLDFEGTTKPNPVIEKEVTIYWKWAIDGDDVTDTQLGSAATLADANSTTRPNAQVNLNVNFTQVD